MTQKRRSARSDSDSTTGRAAKHRHEAAKRARETVKQHRKAHK